MPDLIVRRFGTHEIVHRIELSSIQERHVDRVVRGLMMNMNLDKFYVDESEVTTAQDARKEIKQ